MWCIAFHNPSSELLKAYTTLRVFILYSNLSAITLKKYPIYIQFGIRIYCMYIQTIKEYIVNLLYLYTLYTHIKK